MHIIGASGHAKVVVDIILSLDRIVSGVWDDDSKIISFMDYQVLGSFHDFLMKEMEMFEVVVAIGNNSIRQKLANQLTFAKAPPLVHAKSYVSASAQVLDGTVVMANATVNGAAQLGTYVIVNTNASVDHDCKVENFVHISPQAGLGGNVQVGEGAHIGIGASIIQGVRIGKWATIGAGTVVIKDVPDYAVVVGNPGRIIKYNYPDEIVTGLY